MNINKKMFKKNNRKGNIIYIVKLVLTGGPPSQNSITPRPTMLPCET